MKECFCLLLFMIPFTEGCDVSDQNITVTGYTGGSVLLPCACKDSRSKPEALTRIFFYNQTQNNWTEVFKDEKYKNKLKLFNQSSPANLSLLISDLRKKDEGHYWCQTSNTVYTYIMLKIIGCNLDQNKQTLHVTGYSGESVDLPCSCTELRAKPQNLTWTFTPLNKTNSTTIYPNEKSNKHTIRIKLLNETSPGNLSLHISNLKKEDEGEYHCFRKQQHVNITLSVQEKQNTEGPEDHLVFISLLVFPVLFGVLALIYWKYRGRRNDQLMSSDGLGDANPNSLTQGRSLKQGENEDEVTYSSVVHVKTADKPHIQTVMMTEHSEYASIK